MPPFRKNLDYIYHVFTRRKVQKYVESLPHQAILARVLQWLFCENFSNCIFKFHYYSHSQVLKKTKNVPWQWRIQDFPDGGRQLLRRGRKPIIWHYFCQKLHENERNWTERGHASLVSQLDPPMLGSPNYTIMYQVNVLVISRKLKKK